MQVLLPGRFSFKEFILKEKVQLTSETPANYCPPTFSLSFLSSNQIDVTWKTHCRSKLQQSLPTVSLSYSLHVPSYASSPQLLNTLPNSVEYLMFISFPGDMVIFGNSYKEMSSQDTVVLA